MWPHVLERAQLLNQSFYLDAYIDVDDAADAGDGGGRGRGRGLRRGHGARRLRRVQLGWCGSCGDRSGLGELPLPPTHEFVQLDLYESMMDQ